MGDNPPCYISVFIFILLPASHYSSTHGNDGLFYVVPLLVNMVCDVSDYVSDVLRCVVDCLHMFYNAWVLIYRYFHSTSG